MLYYNYDEYDSLISFIGKVKKTNNTWNDYDKGSYYYNEKRLLSMYLYWTWDNFKKQWMQKEKIEYKYYDNGKIKYVIYSEYNSQLDTWKPTQRMFYQYNGNGRLSQLITSGLVYLHWVDRLRTVFIYDNKDRLITEKRQSNDGERWLNVSRTTYSYNHNDLIVIKIIETFTNAKWYLFEKHIFTYDGNNFLDTILIKKYDMIDEDNPKWIDHHKAIYSRSGHGVLDSLKSFIWKNEQWSPQPIQHSFTDTNGIDYNLFGQKLIFHRTSFILEPVKLKFPQNNANAQDINIKFVWHKSLNAESYILQIATDEDFTNIIQEHHNLKDTTHFIGGYDYNTRYYWRVRVVNEHFAGAWSDTWTFNTKSFSSVYDFIDQGIISPNPATDYIEIAIDNHTLQGMGGNTGSTGSTGGTGGIGDIDRTLKDAVKVYDVLGICVATHPLAPSREGVAIRLDVSGLAAGVYFVLVGSKMYKFVKI
jgi:hypothetical protein